MRDEIIFLSARFEKFFENYFLKIFHCPRPVLIIALKIFLVNDFLCKSVDNLIILLKIILRIFNFKFSVFKIRKLF